MFMEQKQTPMLKCEGLSVVFQLVLNSNALIKLKALFNQLLNLH
jgi:hypothetical protein